jgi:hypothetical protein
VNTTNADNKTYSLCLKNAADYEAMGKPGEGVTERGGGCSSYQFSCCY